MCIWNGWNYLPDISDAAAKIEPEVKEILVHIQGNKVAHVFSFLGDVHKDTWMRSSPLFTKTRQYHHSMLLIMLWRYNEGMVVLFRKT